MGDLTINATHLNVTLGAMMRVYRSFGDRGLDRRAWFSDEVLLTRISDIAGLATYMAAKNRFLDDMNDLLPAVTFRDAQHGAVVTDFINAVTHAERPFDAVSAFENLARY